MRLFGILNAQAFVHGPVETFGQMTVVFGAAAVLLYLWRAKRFAWLWREWITSLDHKKIGIMYIVLALAMGARGFIDAAMMRGQQATSIDGMGGYLSPDHFAQIFTAHGTIMIFFMAMPFMFGLLNLVVPLQLGSRDVAFPFLNSLSFWLTAAGAVLINLSLVVGEFAATGWLPYPPLSELAYSPGVGVDYWIWALQIAGAGTLISGINFIATIIKMRAPGMTMMRLPVFCWTALGSMVLVVFAFPILTVSLALLSLDRTLGMHFFTAVQGGNPMMFVNLIWAWGHPEVYILMLPAFGIFSEVVPVFSQKKLFGYTSMVVATMAITVLSYLVWLHHFFTMGAGANVNAFFGIMTMIIAVPTGVKVFNWLFTMFRGRIVFTTPMLWFMGFLTTFVFGGMTGVLMAVPSADFQLHNSLFLVAHFHNMIIGGVLFGFFAGLSYWFPKVTGFSLDERLGRWAFWLWITGFLTAFAPLYLLGLMGMTRRLYTVSADSGFHALLVVAAIGACIIAAAIAVQAAQIIISIRTRHERRRALMPGGAPDDPWNGRTLEWSIPSPAPAYNFAVIPHVRGRDAWWMMKKEGHAATHPPQPYEDIEVPKSTGLGPVIAGCAFLSGFSLVWHIWWLAGLGVTGAVVLLFIRSFDERTETIIPAEEVERTEARLRQHMAV